MPYYHHPRAFTPLSVTADRKARKNGLRHAIFTSRFDSYIGEWKCDLKEGKGRFTTIGGMLYEGDWYQGYRHGFGLLSKRQSNDTYRLVYRGDWVRGKMEGPGWMYFENGDVYLGFFKRSKKCGYGNMWYANNTFYGGYWKNDVRDGLGLFLLENGCRYEGHWEKGIKSGIGRFYHMNTGQLQEGCWIEDICVKSRMSDIMIRQACKMPTPYPIPLWIKSLIDVLCRGGRTDLSMNSCGVPLGFLILSGVEVSCLELKTDYMPYIHVIIGAHQMRSPKSLLENSELWMLQKVGDIDKNLKYCIDQM